MEQMKCPNCGGNFVSQPEGFYICDHCGAISEGYGTDLTQQDIVDLDNANYRRNAYDFEEALSLCTRVLSRSPLNNEANRGALLARYKIVYLKNGSGEYKPTFLDPDIDSPIPQSPYYRNLSERLKREFDKIEEARRRVLRNAKGIPRYDIFLSYKSGTEEAMWAKECYHMLTRQRGGKRYSVFYDEASLGSKQAGWEPHIYSALKSAKCLILFASSLTNLNSDWVQNEWKRFVWFQSEDSQKQIIVVGKGIDPYKLPDALREGQMLAGDGNTWQTDIMSRVCEICDDANLDELLKNAESYILNGKFKKAKAIYNRMLAHEPNCAEAYLGLLRCRLKAFDDYDIVKQKKNLEKYDEFYKARVLAEAGQDEALQKRIRSIQNAQIARNTASFRRTNYEDYRNRTKGRRIFKRIMAVFSVCAVLALGIFGYWEYSHPLKYSVSSTQATLTGKSIFYDWLGFEELTVDSYDDCPIVAIGDGALRDTPIRSLKLAPTVSAVGAEAFANCTVLETVTVLGSDISFGKNAFLNCTALRKVSFGSAEEDGNTASLSVASPSGRVSVGDGAFENCVSLEEIELRGLANLGAGAFRGCTNLKRVFIDSESDLTVGTGVFDGASGSLVVELPTVAEDLLASLSREYPAFTFATYTRDRVEEVCYFIDRIGTVTEESRAAIEKAEELYEALTPAEQNAVSNYSALRDARAILTAVEAIGRIGRVTLESGSDIAAAESVYGGLNESQKERVGNYSALLDARAVYDVMQSISLIGDVTLQSNGAIERAEETYGMLTDGQKGMVSNYFVLREARNTYDVLFAEDLIERIGIVGEGSGSAIEQAEKAYNALSASLRVKVSNVETLREARLVYNVIVAIAAVGTVMPDSAGDIAVAQTLYAALTLEQQKKVTNSALLEDAPAIYSVVSSIARIGTVGLLSGQSIALAEAAFAGLEQTQQRRVGNASDLTDARAVFDVMLLIDAIGSVSSQGRGAIEAAKDAYDALTPQQRKNVSNAETLNEAVDALRVLDAEDAIRDIGQVTLASKGKIETAEATYGALTDAQQRSVSNHSTLVDARHIYDLLVVIDRMGSVVVGRGTQYSYATLTSGSTSQLNDRSFRNAVDSITFTGIKEIGELVWRNAFPALELVRYDLTDGSAPSSYRVPNGELTYVLVGSTGKKYTMQITAQAGSAVHVGFDNFILENSSLPIDLSNAASSSILFSGNCSVTATGNGANVIQTKDLSIELNASAVVSITAGNGTASSYGGAAITATAIHIHSSASASLTIYGGNGGDGANGENGAKGADSQNGNQNGGRGYDGTAGTNGKDGGAGGNAVSAQSMVIDLFGTATVTLRGGKGGNGGNGGVGGKGGTGMELGLGVNTGDSKAGGNGGAGGAGGVAGAGGAAAKVSSFTINSGIVKLYGGAGGNGGAGGAGGAGGTGSRNTWWTSRGGQGGNGGTGGNGRKGGSGGSGCTVSVTKNGGELTNSSGQRGNGGAKGTGGAAGVGGEGASNKGYAGSKGADGSEGT